MKIGNIFVKNKIVLAPMAGVSNPAYIKIAEMMGASLAFTELLSAEAIVRNNKKTLDMLKGIDLINIPVGVQLFGSNADVLARASKIVSCLYPNVFIDINMGCPVNKVAVKAKSGAYLLKDPDKVYQIVSKVVESVSCPVTVKIRSGWDSDSINAITVAKRIEEAGASAVTVHARTRVQGYSGVACWQIIKEVKENVSIPVIGNGDVKSCFDAKKMLDETGCDLVMIGRACLGNPWIFKECVCYLESGTVLDKPTVKERIDMCLLHFDNLLDLMDERRAILEARSHFLWYLKPIKESKELRNQLLKINDKEQIINLLVNFKESMIE